MPKLLREASILISGVLMALCGDYLAVPARYVVNHLFFTDKTITWCQKIHNLCDVYNSAPDRIGIMIAAIIFVFAFFIFILIVGFGLGDKEGKKLNKTLIKMSESLERIEIALKIEKPSEDDNGRQNDQKTESKKKTKDS